MPKEIFQYDDFERQQKEDTSVQSYMKLHKENIKINNNIICDNTNNSLRPIVPAKYQRIIFDLLHNTSHPGIKATRKLVTQRFTWINVDKNCTEFAKTCEPCQKSKVQVHTKAPLSTFDTAT